jgi:hypothetical protein
MGVLGHARSAYLSGVALCSLMALGEPALAQSTDGPIVPYYGNISPFYGNISPFYGDISAFYGNIAPFYGNISPFYGNISAFWTNDDPFIQSTTGTQATFYGSSYNAFWGTGAGNPFTHNPSPYVNYTQIAGFWSGESANWNTVFTAWQNAQSANDYQNLANLLQSTIINPANNFWGSAVQHGSNGTVTSIADGLLANEGVTITNGQINASSLASVSQTDQAMFFLNFYDQMMSYSGTGHVDWWMGAVNWSPALANGAVGNLLQLPMTIGMLDFTAENGVKDPEGTVVAYGSTVFSDGHGAAVEGLIAGSTDGSGIMGVMPTGSAKVVVYDPYDNTDTTNWTDIGDGYATLVALKINLGNGLLVSGAHVVNASLGVPGWTLNPGWNSVFANNPTLSLGAAHNTILVVAAGNDGVSQTTNVPWNFAINPQLLVVGSVGLNGTISNFSNTPGTACLSDTAGPAGACTQTLASRFIVAPGELILISDNNGNISRQTGTSLAAPLVTGAIGLLQARWPWLVNYPAETADIILDSATKLGTNPGNDPIYGAGELNIQASQSPLNYNNLVYYPVVYGLPSLLPVKASTVINMVNGGNQSAWNAEGLYFTAIETIGNTFRDFEIPMSSKLVGQSTLTLGGVQQFQSYLNSSLQSWIKGGAHLEDNDDVVTSELAGFMETSEPAGNIMGMDVHAKMTPSQTTPGYLQGSSPYNMEMAFVGGGTAVHFGFGSGAAALDSQNGFGLASDYAIEQGGANPLLGLASGGMFFDYRTALSSSLALNFGITQRRDMRDPSEFGLTNATESALLYQARAEQVGLDYAVTPGLLLHTSLTALHEDSGLLGTQSTDAFDLAHGSDTTGLTMGFDLSLPASMLLTASGTMARTTTPDGQALRVTSGGLWSSSEEIALTKPDLFVDEDRMRISFAKSMEADAGGIVYSTYGVVNRQTGQLGVLNEVVDPSSSRLPLSAEALYGRLLWNRTADVSFYVRAETNSAEVATGNSFDYIVGGKFSLDF